MERKKQSEFIKDAEFRMLNRKWLRYSSNIARRVLAVLKDNPELNQTLLSEKVGVTPQYISKVLKGQENLSLETIAKLSTAINTELISFPEYKYSNTSLPKTYTIRMSADEKTYLQPNNEFEVVEIQNEVQGVKEICTGINLSAQ